MPGARSDDQLLTAFTAGTLPPGGFPHADHVRVAWIHLRRWPLLEAIARFTASLKRLAAGQGRPDLYHETVTWAYLFLVHERLHLMPPDHGWPDFAASHPDLLVWKGGLLERYYRPETLQSPRAKHSFVLPDAAPMFRRREAP